MTPEQLLSDPETHKRIAKRWCEIMGLDADEIIDRVYYPQTQGDFVRHFSEPRWQHVAREVPAQLAWIRVMMEVV